MSGTPVEMRRAMPEQTADKLRGAATRPVATVKSAETLWTAPVVMRARNFCTSLRPSIGHNLLAHQQFPRRGQSVSLDNQRANAALQQKNWMHLPVHRFTEW
jgi:hypothetical protein